MSKEWKDKSKNSYKSWIYHEQPVCTSLLFTLLFIKSQYSVSFLVHLIVFFLHILLFFCTSHCLLHILLFFAHPIVLHFLFHCTFYSYFSFLTICMPLCYVTYIICILIVLHCHWADLIRLHFTSSYALYNYYVTNKETLNLEPWIWQHSGCIRGCVLTHNSLSSLVSLHHRLTAIMFIPWMLNIIAKSL